MSKMIQIRNVPDNLHRSLKIRAAKESMSLSDYLLSEIAEIADKPSTEELLEMIANLPPLKLKSNPVDIIREQRDLS